MPGCLTGSPAISESFIRLTSRIVITSHALLGAAICHASMGFLAPLVEESGNSVISPDFFCLKVPPFPHHFPSAFLRNLRG
ncbi:hypothetical protein VN12_01645 [Pirellula sp. SH-Sr6A]|nr:hypothetical protein VN12_01645 [Pirellula sp. SH-Sr6A]